MKLSKETIDILKAFAAINTNLIIKPGKKFATKGPAGDIFAEYEGNDEFDTQISVFNLNELLGVIGSFSDPDISLSDKSMTIKEGKSKVTYVYADESILTVPDRNITINMPPAEVKFNLTEDDLNSTKKMAGILSVEDVAFIGDGNKIIARVFDEKNPSGNSFDIDLGAKTKDNFNILIKVDKMKLPAGSYKVEISSKRIAKFTHDKIKLTVYIATESTSTFG
jgi:hypothetical protein